MAEFISIIFSLILLSIFGLYAYLLIAGIIAATGLVGQICPNCRRFKLFQIAQVSEPSPSRCLFRLQYECKACGYRKHEFVSKSSASSVSWSGGAGASGGAGGGGGGGGCGGAGGGG